MTRGTIFIALLVFVMLAGCLPSPYYQRVDTVPGAAWDYSFKPVFHVEVTDTNAVYKPYFIIRHTQGYPFNNVWMLVSVKGPGDKAAHRERVNIVLAEPSGKWMGRGMGEVYEQRLSMKLEDTAFLRRKGVWEITLEQNMRVNPLPEVLSTGIRVEKAPPSAR